MSFQPILLTNGIIGWNFLKSTYDDQMENFKKNPVLERDNDYFAENIAKVETAEDLVKDRRLLSVALGAFGLDDQIDNKALIQKVLEDGTSADDNLASRLDDGRWVDFSKAFGFGAGETRTTGDAAAMAGIVSDNEFQSFEVAVGEQDEALRIALYAQRELQDIIYPEDAGEDGPTINAQWYNIIGQPQLADMMKVALNLPSETDLIDVDQQVEVYKEAAQRYLGTDDLTEFADPEKMDDLITKYLARSEIAALGSSLSPAATALSLLQQF